MGVVAADMITIFMLGGRLLCAIRGTGKGSSTLTLSAPGIKDEIVNFSVD